MTLRPWLIWPLAMICGLWAGLVHAPFNWPFIGIFGFAAAFWLARLSERAKIVGYAFGLGYFALTMAWIREPFAVGPPEYAMMWLPAWALMAAGLALFWLPIFMPYRMGAWAVGAVFLAMELLRGWIFTGLPWALIAYGFVDTPIAQNAALIGSYALSALIVLAALLIGGSVSVKARIAGVVLALSLFSYDYLRQVPDDLSLVDYRVRLVQANIPQADRWKAELAQSQLEAQLALSQGDADIIIWPEASSYYEPLNSPELLPYMHEKIDAPAILFGGLAIESGNYYNAAYLSLEKGAYYRYDKVHLVPFGEYIPFGDWLLEKGLFINTVTQFSTRKGQERQWPDFDIPRPNILICYEGIFPKLARREGEYLIQITNDSWFGMRAGPQQHLALARMRAVENGLPLARSAITGISALIGSRGEIIEKVAIDMKGGVTGALGAKYSATIYRRFGEWASMLLLVVAGLAMFVKRKSPRIRQG